jgi:hypothetical protein
MTPAIETAVLRGRNRNTLEASDARDEPPMKRRTVRPGPLPSGTVTE